MFVGRQQKKWGGFFLRWVFFFRSLPGMNSGTKKKDAHDLKGCIFVRLVYVPFFGLVAWWRLLTHPQNHGFYITHFINFESPISTYMCHGQKSLYWGWSSHLNRNPYNGYINPYYWVDDHPLLYGNNGSLDPGTHVLNKKSTYKTTPPTIMLWLAAFLRAAVFFYNL